MCQFTAEHTRQTFLRVQERQGLSLPAGRGPCWEWPLTQEKLLREGEITEELNLLFTGDVNESELTKRFARS